MNMSQNIVPNHPVTAQSRAGGYFWKVDLLKYLKQQWPSIAEESFCIKYVHDDRMTFKAPRPFTEADWEAITDLRKERQKREEDERAARAAAVLSRHA